MVWRKNKRKKGKKSMEKDLTTGIEEAQAAKQASKQASKQGKYYGIDYLRTIACIGIAMMHIKANTDYNISGWVYDSFISSLTDFVYLFMAISAFGMCCGYYDKVMSGKVNWTEFYKKRYIKILPFFALLVFIDVAMERNFSSLLEGITELTLLHGFIPQSLTVIGVGWYLGTVYVFYLTFSFFCVLIEKKRRAWMALVVSLILHFICVYYFDLDRHNFVFSLCYFLIGGLIYLYREKLRSVSWKIYLPLLIIALAAYYMPLDQVFVENLLLCLLIFVLLSFSLSTQHKPVGVISFISGISMEIYLSHMVMFRVVEKLHLSTVIGSGWPQYILTVCLVLAGAIFFSFVMQTMINRLMSR